MLVLHFENHVITNIPRFEYNYTDNIKNAKGNMWWKKTNMVIANQTFSRGKILPWYEIMITLVNRNEQETTQEMVLILHTECIPTVLDDEADY